MSMLNFIKLSFKRKNVFSFFLLILLFSFFVFSQASTINAESLLDSQTGFTGNNEIGGTFGAKSKATDIRLIVASVIKVIIGLLGIIFVSLLVWAGFKWMTSGGSDDKIKEAQDLIKTAIIGLIIVLASYAITAFVINNVIYSVEGDFKGAIFGN